MSLRRDAHPGAVGRESLSFFDGTVKPSLSAQAVDRSGPRRFMTKCPITPQGDAKSARKTIKAVYGGYVGSLRGPPQCRHANENLARLGSAHIIVAHLMDKQLPPLALRRFGRNSGFC